MAYLILAVSLVLMFSVAGCDQASSEIDYRGEKIKLSKPYRDYDEYKNDPDNIHPSETARVQGLVMSAPIAGVLERRCPATE
jgi:hypothetical protein